MVSLAKTLRRSIVSRVLTEEGRVKMNSISYRYISRTVVASIAILAAMTLNAISGCAPKPAAPIGMKIIGSRSQRIAFLQQELIVLKKDRAMSPDQRARHELALQQQILALSLQTTP